MKTAVRTALSASAILLAAAAGCKQGENRLITMSPSRAELPTFAQPEQTLTAVVGVEGVREAPRGVIVPQYKKIELTPEEREALGEREPPIPDALLFYRPPRGPEDGVSPESFQMLTGISGVGGALIGYESASARFGTQGVAGRYSAEYALSRFGASVGLAREPAAEVGRGWGVIVGEGLARQGARRAPGIDR
jgi:hypothetical protein